MHDQTWRPLDCPPTASTYANFVEAVRRGERGTRFRRAANLQRLLDLAFDSDHLGVALSVPGDDAPAHRDTNP